MLANVLFLSISTCKTIFRNKFNIIIYFVLPIISVIFAFTISNISGNSLMNIGVLDRDHGIISKDLVASLNTYHGFKLNYITEDDIEHSMKRGNLDYIVVIPEDFTEGVYHGNISQLEVRSFIGKEATIWLENYVNSYLNNLRIIVKASDGSKYSIQNLYTNFTKPSVEISNKLLKDQTRDKRITQKSIGFLMILIMLGASIIFDSIISEKKNKTFYRIYASPVTKKAYWLSKVLVSFILMLFQIIIVLLVLVYVFHIELYMPVYIVLLLLVSFSVTSIIFWIMLVSFVKDSFHVGLLKLLTILPTSMLGGCFWSVSKMPLHIQRVADFIPQKWVTTSMEKYQEGIGMSEYIVSISVLMLFSATFYLIARYMFKNHKSLYNFL